MDQGFVGKSSKPKNCVPSYWSKHLLYDVVQHFM